PRLGLRTLDRIGELTDDPPFQIVAQPVLGPEMVRDEADGDPGLGGNGAQRGRRDPLGREQAQSSGADPLHAGQVAGLRRLPLRLPDHSRPSIRRTMLREILPRVAWPNSAGCTDVQEPVTYDAVGPSAHR